MDSECTARQLAEIEALEAIYAGDGEFEVLEMPSESAAKGASFKVLCPSPVGRILVMLPPTYPVSGLPSFAAQDLRASDAKLLADGLHAYVQDREGAECVFEVLSSVEEIAAAAGIEEKVETAKEEQTASGKAACTTWVQASDRGTLLQLSLNSGQKVKSTQITNISELRRIASAACVCVDVAPSKNTENYELAALLSHKDYEGARQGSSRSLV
eukprot:TRINITY_DN7789_c2_g3_i2.p1 TRINITY_DN7789_c2_g3~~TRINITY_DN7789_c2_g3_i2.p1  ORF type:complete len:231 (-),score=66.25 TRINITY_DN7789_c2_g3_i2:234-875(-)